MSTTVILEVVLDEGVDPNAVAAVVAAAGQKANHGRARRGNGPWRLRFQLSGEDRIGIAKRLEAELQALGYDATAGFWR